MPRSVELLDAAACVAGRFENADYNLVTQDVLTPTDLICLHNWEAYGDHGYSSDQNIENRFVIYSSSALGRFARKLCSLSPAERLEEIRNPQSSIRWAYAFILDHMLGCILSPQANELSDLYEAAYIGNRKYIDENGNEDRNGVTGIRMNSYVVIQGFRILRQYEVYKALSRTISVSDLEHFEDDCPICYDTLREESSDTEWPDANPENFLCEPTLSAIVPEFIPFICDWDETSCPRPPPGLDRKARYFLLNTDARLYYHSVAEALQGGEAEEYESFVSQVRGPLTAKYQMQKKENEEKEDKEPSQPKNFAVELECNHKFHRTCIRRWLETENLCPYCRFAVVKTKIQRNEDEDGGGDAGDDDVDDAEDGVGQPEELYSPDTRHRLTELLQRPGRQGEPMDVFLELIRELEARISQGDDEDGVLAEDLLSLRLSLTVVIAESVRRAEET